MTVNLGRLDGKNGFRIDGLHKWDQSGFSVAAAGDINHDGIDDFVMGSFAGGQQTGATYVIFGTQAGFPARFDLASLDGTNGFRIDGINPYDYAGVAVDGAGDLNDDGIDDLIVGSDMADPGGRDRAGQGYVIFGKASGFAASLDLASLDGSNGFRINGAAVLDDIGWTVAGTGDVNGDGIDDAMIGGFRSGDWLGVSYVVFGSRTAFAADLDPSTLDGTNGFSIHGIVPGDRVAWSNDGAGDVNGDGLADLIVGAPEADPDGKSNAGETYVIFGTRAGFAADIDLTTLDGTNGFRIPGVDAGDQSGRAVGGAGDVNGDGIDDIIIGARGGDPHGKWAAGETYVVFGTKTGFGATIDLAALDGTNGFRLDGTNAHDWSGVWVAKAGDFNGDGIDDMIVGSFGKDDAGVTYLVFGTDKGFAPSLDLAALDGTDGFRLDGLNPGDNGRAASGAGDINDDGYDDLLVGAWLAEPGGKVRAGQTYVVYGHATGDGSERLVGTPGVDDLSGLAGNDTILGRAGADRLFGGAGNDAMVGGNGDDYLFGGTGDDRMLGGAGSDRLLGWSGRDLLSGGAGADTLSGGGGNDRLTGGRGGDVFEFEKRGGADHITDFGFGNDRIDVSDFGFASRAEVLALGEQHGDDVIFALGFGTRVVLADHMLADLSAGNFLI